MAIRPDAEQEYVELRCSAITRCTGEFIGKREGCGGNPLALVGWHGMHVRLGDRHMVDERRARRRLIALGVTVRQESLITPPQVHTIPVNLVRVTCEAIEHERPHSATRHSDVVHPRRCENHREGLGHRVGQCILVVEDPHDGRAHASESPAIDFRTSP